jgi:hypothetical protein
MQQEAKKCKGQLSEKRESEKFTLKDSSQNSVDSSQHGFSTDY